MGLKKVYMKKAKLNICRSVFLVDDNLVVHEKDQTVNSTPLFSEYLKHAERWGVHISKDEFCEILDTRYSRRYSRFGIEYQDLKLV